MNEDEVIVEPEDDSEFEEVLTEYLDAVDIVEARNEFRDIPQNMERAQGFLFYYYIRISRTNA